MRELSKRSFDVWEEYLNHERNEGITERILMLDSYETLTPEQEDELKILINLEKKFLAEAESACDANRKYLRAYNKIIAKIQPDDRLLTIFDELIDEYMANNEVLEESDLQTIYVSMMEEDMDVIGHERLNKIYEFIKDEESKIIENEPCGKPDCIYCKPLSKNEYNDALDALERQGFLEDTISEKEKLARLMVTIHRLQIELDIWKNKDMEFPDDEDDTDDDY